jgi:hypothetical protein
MVYHATQSNGGNSVEFRFQNPAIFQNRLNDLEASGGQVMTQVAPGGDTTQQNTDESVRTGCVTDQEDQRLAVSQLIPPKMCKRKAETDDLVEISYIGRVLETGAIFDGSAIMINGEWPGYTTINGLDGFVEDS